MTTGVHARRMRSAHRPSPAHRPATLQRRWRLTAARAGLMRAVVFIPPARSATASCRSRSNMAPRRSQIEGNFDDAMRAGAASWPTRLGIYLLNSINPFRLEGQKTIMSSR